MKTFAFATVTLAALFAGLAAEAAEPAKEDRKLEGDELAKFYLQQILEQAEDEPVEAEQRDLMQELKLLVNRLEAQHREQLAKQQAEAEKQAAARQAKLAAEEQRRLASDGPAAEITTDSVVTLKPVLGEATAAPAAANVLPPMRNAAPAPPRVQDPAVRPAGAELPLPAGGDGALEVEDGGANGPLEGADQRPRWEQVRGLVAALDHVIVRLQMLRAWLIVATQAS
jgi:hypothetical protein